MISNLVKSSIQGEAMTNIIRLSDTQFRYLTGLVVCRPWWLQGEINGSRSCIILEMRNSHQAHRTYGRLGLPFRASSKLHLLNHQCILIAIMVIKPYIRANSSAQYTCVKHIYCFLVFILAEIVTKFWVLLVSSPVLLLSSILFHFFQIFAAYFKGHLMHPTKRSNMKSKPWAS